MAKGGGYESRGMCPRPRVHPPTSLAHPPPPLSPPRKGEGDLTASVCATCRKRCLSPRFWPPLECVHQPHATGSATNVCGETAGRGKEVASNPWAKRTEVNLGETGSTPSRRAGQCQKTRYPEADTVSLKPNTEAASASGPVTLFDIPGSHWLSGASVCADGRSQVSLPLVYCVSVSCLTKLGTWAVA